MNSPNTSSPSSDKPRRERPSIGTPVLRPGREHRSDPGRVVSPEATDVTPTTLPLPYQGTMAGFRRFSVAEYHRLIELGILTEDDNLELLEGYLVHKMARNPPHDVAIQQTNKRLVRLTVPASSGRTGAARSSSSTSSSSPTGTRRPAGRCSASPACSPSARNCRR